ncbi:unnamed protein product, partial [Mesorhabditis belari]|uniref:EGF-like domain-containing protein n=1 Tax=Mesorhabditis belari TaxID=2138241 RepID=A0AAF3J8J5_9BILA
MLMKNLVSDLSKVDIIPPRGSLIDITPIDISTIGRESSACAGGCGGHGTCTLSGCLCNGGYSGKDCQEILPPVCTIACAHGSCSGSLCSCYAGWMGVDCSLALCPELRNCSNHGYCTSSDRCFCDAGYTGPDCSIEMCSPSNCFHGNCSTGNCACDEGWHGKRCRTPICSTRCSFNGICSSPEQCQCFIDYRGPTCNECSTEDCVGCDPPCEHGECDPIAKTCICHDGWKGISCGDCPSNLCQSKPSIAYILPQTVDVEETNLIVSVHGKNFPRASEYSCIFGTLKAPGKFVSSSLVRCAIPEEMSIGRHVFTLEPETTHEHIESVDEKPIHFTFTERISQKCQGSDLGPLCVCAIGKSGADCAIIELIAQIDRQFITNQRANEGAEGTPYLVKLPLFENSVIQVSSTAPGLQFDSSKNLIVWENPIGSTKPYNISLSIWNANGPNEIDWPLKVPPSYKAKIEGFEMVGSTQKRRIFGRIDKPLPNRPVILQIRRDGAKSEEFLVETDENGFFSSEYTPDWNFGGKYHVSASHPGEVKSVDDHFEISWSTPNIEVTYNERPTRDQLKSGVEYLVENVGEVAISGWKLQIASGNLSIDSVEQSTKSLEFREGARVLVKYSMVEDFSGPFTVLLVTDSGLTRVIRQEVPMRRVLKSLSSTPKSLIVPLIFNALPTVQIHLDTTDTKISSPLQLGFETRPEPFYLIGSDPPLSNYAEYSANDRGLTLFLGGTPDGSRVNGTIHILYRGDIILRIPYTFSRRETDLFPLAICLQDEQYSEFSSIKTNAQIELVNSTNGVVMNPRSAIVNGSPQIFTIYPGFYQLTVTADQHQTYEEAIYVTPSNESFCVRLATKVTNIMPIFNGKHFSIDKIAKNQISPIPQVILFPSFITEKTEEIEAFIDGHLTKETYVYFDEIKTQFLNIKASTSAISVGDSAKIQVDAHSLNDLFKDQCDAIIFNVPYHISKNNSVDILHNTQVIVGKTEQARKLCDENLQSVSLAVKTSIQCNCANGVRENCRQKYTSAMGCGGGWKMIADDTVSLENFAMILHLVAECQQMRIYFDELKGSISCIASLDAECPLSNRLKREISESEEKKWLEDNQIPAFEPRMTSRKMKSIEISDQWDSSFTKALDVQAISFAAQFLEFFERFEEIFPLPTLKSFPTRFWNEFFQSIADHSENGMKISEGENEKLLGNVQNGATFLKLWNNSVSEWASGRIRPFEDSSPHPLIKYSQLKALIAAADKLKSISRQNGAPDPFAMLHAYMGQVLSTAGLDEADLCAESHIIIEPNVVDEGEIIVLTVNFENLKPTFLNAIRLEIEWVRGDVYTPEVKFAPGIFSYTGIHALDGSQSLPGKSSFQAIAKYTTAPGPRLTREVVYQPIVIVSFENGEKKSIQKLQSFPVIIRPKPALKVHYFIQQEKASHFVYVIFVNNGYVTLKNVRVINFKVGYEKANKEPTRFRIDEMRIDGIQKNGGLSYELGMIKPGKTKVATFRVFPLDNEGFLHSIQSQTLVDERLLPFEENKPLAIRWILEKGLIVSPLESEEPRFYFDQKAATISNIIELQNIKKTSSDSNVNGRLYHRISTVFMNPESQSFRGVFLGKILLSTMDKNFKLIRLNEVGSKLTNIQRNLNGPKWIQKENGVDYLNFIDSTALMALPSNTISYEAIFADPNDFPTPIFEQNLYRIQVHPDSWPIPGTSIGSISAFSPIDSPLEFSLYSSIGDETFSIDKNTGEIFVENELRKNEEQCVIVEVKDQHGNSATVPLSINSGGQQKSCVSRGVSGMKPLIHIGETVETSPPTESPWVSFPTPGLLSTPDVTTENFETSTFQTEITENENHSSETSQATASQEVTDSATTRKQDETEISTWETTVTNGHTEIIHSITPDNEPTEWTTSTIRTAITTQAIESTTESITFYTNRPDGEPSTLSPTDFPTPDILTTETGETTVDSGEIHSTMILTPDETPEPITRITPVEQT